MAQDEKVTNILHLLFHRIWKFFLKSFFFSSDIEFWMTCIFWNILMGFIYHSHFLMKHFLVHISISKWRIAHLQFFPSSSSDIFSYLQFLHGRVIWKYLRSTSIQVQKFAPIFHDILTQILAKACIFPSFNGKAAVSSRAIERKVKYIYLYICM